MDLIVAVGVSAAGLGTVIADSIGDGIPVTEWQAQNCILWSLLLVLLAGTMGLLGWISYPVIVLPLAVGYAGLLSSVLLLVRRSYLL